jgi:hypothetical protein
MFHMSAGAELVDRIVAEMNAAGLEPDGKERELLSIAEGLADRLAELEVCVATDALCTVLSSGRVVANPVVAESRMTRTSLATVLGKISMDEGRAKDPQKQAAARARWLGHNIAKQGNG